MSRACRQFGWLRSLAFATLSMVLSTSIAFAQLPEPTQSVTPTEEPAAAKSAPAPNSAAKKSNAASVDKTSLLRQFTSGNPMVWALGFCSIATLGFSLERFVALRRGRVIPREFVRKFQERLSSGKLDRERGLELCRANDSPVSRIFAEVVRHWGQPAASIRAAVTSGAASEILDLKRNVRALNATATLAPLLGLLGTVIGMIESFDALGGKSGLDKGEALARGISLALVATAIGLAIAVVSVAMYYYLLNKVDLLVRDLDEEARQVVDQICAETLRPAIVDRRVGEPMSRHESRSGY